MKNPHPAPQPPVRHSEIVDKFADYNEISNTATNLGWAHVTKDGFLIVGTKRLGNMKNKNRTLNKFYTYVAKQVLKR